MWGALAERRAAARPPPPALLFTPATRGRTLAPRTRAPTANAVELAQRRSKQRPPLRTGVRLGQSTGVLTPAPPRTRGPRRGGLSPLLNSVKLRVVGRGQATEDRAGTDEGAAPGAGVVGPPQRVERHPPTKLPPPALMIQRERAAVPPAALRSRNGGCWKDAPPWTPRHTPGPPNGAPAGVVRVPRRVVASTQKNLFLLDRGRPRTRPPPSAAGGGWGGGSELLGTALPCSRASVCASKGVGLAGAIPADAEGAAPPPERGGGGLLEARAGAPTPSPGRLFASQGPPRAPPARSR